ARLLPSQLERTEAQKSCAVETNWAAKACPHASYGLPLPSYELSSVILLAQNHFHGFFVVSAVP
ncbi:MAG: hypothetical protein NTW03_19660, partial [Verrucomicrobia bacterium]|nr:hypothetical protein [Verrucomicrobiota bacterium]